MSVIEHDFGKEKRLTMRRFRELLRLDALHEANVRANPLPYLERASELIYQLERILFESAQAATSQFDRASSTETIMVDKAEYERLLSCRSIIERGLAEFGAG
jgi:hypothetical protein